MAVVVGTAQGKLTLDASKFISNIDSSYKALKSFNDLVESTQKSLNQLSNPKSLKLDTSSLSVPNVNIDPKNSISTATTNVGKLQSALGTGLTATLDGVGKLAETTFSTFTKYTEKIVGFAKESVQYGQQFDATMSQVGAIAKADEKDLEALRNTAIDMGEQTKFSAAEAAQGMVYMGMAGWNTEEIIAGLPGVMNLAAASGEDLATTSDIVTDALTAFGLKAEDATHFSDVLAEASTDSNTNVALMGETFKYVASMAGTMKYNIEDTAVAIGLMANIGIKGSQSGTAFRNVLTNMAKPSKSVATAMDELGVSLEDGKGNAYDLMTVMKNLRQAFGDIDAPAEQIQAKIAGLNVELESGLISEEDYLHELETVETEGLESLTVAQARLASGLAGKYGLSGLLGIVNATDEEFQDLTNQIYTSSTDLNLVTSAIQNSGIAWGQYLSDAQASERGMQTIAASIVHDIQGLGKSTDEIKDRLQLEYNISADDALKAIWSVEDALDESSGAAKDMSEKMMDNLQGSITYFESAMGTFKIRISDILKEPAKNIVNFGTESIKKLTRALKTEGIPGLIKAVGEIIPEGISMLVEYIPQILPSLIDGFWALVNGLIDALPEALPILADAAFNLFLGLGTGLVDAVSKIANDLPTYLQILFPKIEENIPKMINTAVKLFLAIIQGITKAIPEIVKELPTIIKEVVKTLLENRSDIIKAGIDLIFALIKGITDPEVIKSLIEATWEIINTIIGQIGSVDWWQTADDIFAGLSDGLLNVMEGACAGIDALLGTNFAGWAKEVHQWFNDLRQQAAQWGKDLADSMHKTEIELNKFGEENADALDNFRRLTSELIKEGIDAQTAMATAYQKYITSAEAQYYFKERMAGSFVGESGTYANLLGSEGWTPAQLMDMLVNTQAYTGNTYNFYSPKEIDEKTAAEEMEKANKQALLGQ